MTTRYHTIVETAELALHLNDPSWLIFDCRFDLADPAFGRRAYTQAHLPGAIYADLNGDLSSPVSASSGRHPLPQEAEFARLCAAWGVEAGKQVVVYDQAGGGFAGRLWWLLKYYGHEAVAVLNGGYAKWTGEGRPVDADRVAPAPGRFIPSINRAMAVSADELDALRQDPHYLVVDARAEPRYKGVEEPIDPVAGHIPGAVNRFHGSNLTAEGALLDDGVLREQFTRLTQGIPASNVIVYCGSGVTSCHHILAMQHAGLGLARLYPGSWSEWIRDPSRPIAAEK